MQLFPLLTLLCVTLAAYSLEVVFGFAGTILLLAAVSFLYPAKLLVVYSLMPQLITASVALCSSPSRLDRRFLGGMILYAALGAGVGAVVFRYLPPHPFELLLGVLIVLVGLYLTLFPRGLRIPHAGARALDILVGCSQVAFGISGPIVMTRLMSVSDDKTTIRNHALAFFASLNAARFLSYLLTGAFTEEVLTLMGIIAPFLLGTLLLAVRMHARVDATLFKRITALLILVSGTLYLLRTMLDGGA